MRWTSRRFVLAAALAAPAVGIGAFAIGRRRSRDPARNLDAGGLALRGWDPVAYFQGRATPGRAEFAATHARATYRFASAENRAAFLAEPSRFLPQYGGFCAWAAAQGYKADADPEAFDVVEGRLFLNYDRNVQSDWRRDVPGNVARADSNWPALRDKRP